ncbi:hypothetical protein NPIL_223901 [Nephila pilipes]|uniref:Uncharacterized protein n=1 Tax=Nephila pilipes TaxID=299642 RepID=A0A8X6U480_NEPPI|nr:hypothetical protein NPIL_223901 [Nephila pilipes]
MNWGESKRRNQKSTSTMVEDITDAVSQPSIVNDPRMLPLVPSSEYLCGNKKGTIDTLFILTEVSEENRKRKP